MTLILVRDAKEKRERILNTDCIFEVREDEQLLRINFRTGGEAGRNSAYVEGTLGEFAKQLGAVKLGA